MSHQFIGYDIGVKDTTVYFSPKMPTHERCRNLRALGYRLCHNRSARKHRKQRHEVFYVAEGLYAWKVK